MLIVSYNFFSSVFQLDQQSSVSTALELEYNVRNPPRGSRPVSQQHPAEERWSHHSTGSPGYSTRHSTTDSPAVQETVVRQNIAQSEPPEQDQLDIPVDIPLFEGISLMVDFSRLVMYMYE